ncbi:MAG: hypothetical protein KKA67_01585 [Spirochaetes bacterium]|nr:hypothetical protein [Spirochaetota bacterium]MBU1080357.1 hypothetical protein [Spirochaetota bacterium]
MRRTYAIFAAILISGLVRVSAQDSTELIDTYRRNFIRSSLGTKLELLKEASAYDSVDMGPLYDTAVQFVLGNASLLATDAILRDMSVLSVNMIRKYKYAPAAENLWQLFGVYKDSLVRVPLLQTLADVAGGNKTILKELNSYLDTQVSLFKSGVRLDLAVLDAAVFAVGRLGDSSSFPYLFAAYTASVSKAITDRAGVAMAALSGDYAAFLADVIRTNPPAEKSAALEAGLRGDALPAEKRAELAEVALSVGVSYQSSVPGDQVFIVALRTSAARELTTREWQKASPLAIKHFYDFQIQYNRGQVSKSNFLESIALLGAMGTTEAAQALSLYLQLVNIETEQGKSFDEQVTLAVVNNLGRLGDKSAFDYLLYIGYLQYPESVKKAARDALQKLRW